MVQLDFLSGRERGSARFVRRFPCLIGRNASSDLRAEDPGVWDRHLEIDLDLLRGFVLKALPEALVCVNGQPTGQIVLKNGDLVEIGSLKIRFWLERPRQRSLAVREFLTWLALSGLSLGQLALIYWLPR